MPNEDQMVVRAERIRRRILWGIGLVLVLLIIPFTILLVRAFDARSMPDLELWHRVELATEFRADRFRPGMTFKDYLKIEDGLFVELNEKLYEASGSTNNQPFSRYVRRSRSDPEH